MSTEDWSRSVEIPAEALELTPEAAKKLEELVFNARVMAHSAHLSLRRVARQAGMKELPGYVVYVGPRGGPMQKIVHPPEDLSVLLPGEEP